MSDSLGMQLRGAREAQGLTIEQLSSLTKINGAFITALEEGRWDLLPGRIYVKTFTKLYAEALNMNVDNLYAIIDGVTGEKPKVVEPVKEKIIKDKNVKDKINEPVKPVIKGIQPSISQVRKKTDYKLPIFSVIVLLLIISGSIFVKTRMGHPGKNKNEMATTAPIIQTGPPKWERPWERPASDITYYNSQRLRLKTSAPVWIRIIADGDTVYTGVMAPDSGRTFTADKGFLVSVGKNDRVNAFLNGIKVRALGASEGPLRNYPVGIKEKKE